MNKKRLLYLALGLAFIIALISIKYIWSDVDDFSSKKAEKSFTFSEIINEATNSDTTKLNGLKEKLIEINGIVKKISVDSNNTTIEIGDTLSTSSIICQMDKRHTNDLTNVKEMSTISVKGKLNGINKDDELGLGTTIELNYCILNK